MGRIFQFLIISLRLLLVCSEFLSQTNICRNWINNRHCLRPSKAIISLCSTAWKILFVVALHVTITATSSFARNLIGCTSRWLDQIWKAAVNTISATSIILIITTTTRTKKMAPGVLASPSGSRSPSWLIIDNLNGISCVSVFSRLLVFSCSCNIIFFFPILSVFVRALLSTSFFLCLLLFISTFLCLLFSLSWYPSSCIVTFCSWGQRQVHILEPQKAHSLGMTMSHPELQVIERKSRSEEETRMMILCCIMIRAGWGKLAMIITKLRRRQTPVAHHFFLTPLRFHPGASSRTSTAATYAQSRRMSRADRSLEIRERKKRREKMTKEKYRNRGWEKRKVRK